MPSCSCARTPPSTSRASPCRSTPATPSRRELDSLVPRTTITESTSGLVATTRTGEEREIQMLSREYPNLYIDGQWQEPDSKERFDVIAPHTGEKIGYVPAANEADIDRAVEA